MSFRSVCGEKVLSNFFSPSITDIDRKLICLCSNFFRPSWRHCLLRVQGINLTKEKRFAKSLFVSFIICEPWAKKSRLFSENNRQRCQNGLPRVQGDFLQRIFFFEKVLFLFQHWALSELFLSIRRKFVGPVVSTVFCLSNGPVCGENIIVQKFFSHHFWTLIAKWSIFVRFFSARLTTLHSTGARDQFEELRPFWKTLVCFIYHLRTLSQKIKAFFRKTIDRFVKIAHHVSKGIFCREFFSKKFFFYLIIGHWATFVCHFDENLSVPLSVLLSVCHLDQFVVKKSLSNFFFSISYGHVSQNYWSLLKFFSAKLTTLLSTSPKDQFEVKHLLWKVFVCFLSFSNIEREINGFFVGKQIAVLSKLLTTCQGDLLKIFLFWKSSFFAHHWSLIDFISGISTNNSLLCPQNCFLSVHCNILW